MHEKDKSRQFRTWLHRKIRPTKATVRSISSDEFSSRSPEAEEMSSRSPEAEESSSPSSESDVAIQPPPYGQVSQDEASLIREEILSASSPPGEGPIPDANTAAASSITAAFDTIAASDAMCRIAAQSVAEVIAFVANIIIAVPHAEAQRTAAAIATAINLHAANTAAGLPDQTGTIWRQTIESVPPGSKPAIDRYLASAHGLVSFLVGSGRGASRAHVAAAVCSAVAKVGNVIAAAPGKTRTTVAAAFILFAAHAADQAADGAREPSLGEFTLKLLNAAQSERRRAGGADPVTYDAAAQASNLQAALSALRAYATSIGHVDAARALEAVLAGSRLLRPATTRSDEPNATHASCSCAENLNLNPTGPGCDAVLHPDRLLAALSAVQSLHARTPESEAARALAAALASAPDPPAQPGTEGLDGSEIRRRRDALMQVVREMDGELARLEHANSDSLRPPPNNDG